MTATRNKPPEPAATWEPVASLVPWDGNPRRISSDVVRRVAASIERFGFGAPVVARRADRVLIAGHVRLFAAQALGLERVPVRFLDLDAASARLLALADNKLGEAAEWDEDRLAAVLRAASAFDAALVGFDEAAVARLVAAAEAVAAAVPDEDASAPADEDHAPPAPAIRQVVLVYDDPARFAAALRGLAAVRAALGLATNTEAFDALVARCLTANKDAEAGAP